MALIGNIEWRRGDSFPIEIILKNKSTGAAIDITGCSFKFTVNREPDPATEDQQVFQVIGDLNVDPTTGKVSFTPTTANTNFIGNTFFDIEMTDVDSNIRTITDVGLQFNVSQDITKT